MLKKIIHPALFLSFSFLSIASHGQCKMDNESPEGTPIDVSTAVLDASTNEVVLFAADFFYEPMDNCTSTDSLRFTFDGIFPEADPSFQSQYNSSSMVMDCDAVNNSPIQIEVTVWDLSGNFMSAIVPVTVIPQNDGDCYDCETDSIPPSAFVVDVASAILSPETNEVKLYAVDMVFASSDDCISDDLLRYTFSNVPPELDPNYEDEFRSSTLIFNCIDVLDSPIEIEVFVWDLNGNVSSGTTDLTLVSNSIDCGACVNDSIAPTAEFFENIVWVLYPDSTTVEIWASDLVLSATDVCSGSSQLDISFSATDPDMGAMTFDCYDLMNSPFPKEVFVWDENGNITSGSVEIYLQGDCSTFIEEINGVVSKLDGTPMVNALVSIVRPSGEIVASTQTDELGNYTIQAIRKDNFITITYEDATSPLVSSLDLVAMQRHLLGLWPLTGPQVLASDLDSDGKLKINDLIMVRKAIYGIIDLNNYVNTDWQFVNENIDVYNTLQIEENMIPMTEAGPLNIVGFRKGDPK